MDRSDNEFIDLFEKWCDDNIDHEEPITICGDFNINLLNKTCSTSKRILRVIQSLGLKQIVTEPTRVTENTKSLIDYVVTNNYNMKASVLLDDKISDHSTITFNTGEIKVNNVKFIERLVNYSKEVFINNLLNVEWYNSYS